MCRCDVTKTVSKRYWYSDRPQHQDSDVVVVCGELTVRRLRANVFYVDAFAPGPSEPR
ncbi:hypothetical protein QFZ57_002576 [Arthrobacter sp. B1I2]|nr:hypothetical protein [Arthrobacter sp. B1I2]